MPLIWKTREELEAMYPSRFDAAWTYYKQLQHIIPPNEQSFRHGYNAGLMAAAAICESGEGVVPTGETKEHWYETGWDYAQAIKRLEVEVQT